MSIYKIYQYYLYSKEIVPVWVIEEKENINLPMLDKELLNLIYRERLLKKLT